MTEENEINEPIEVEVKEDSRARCGREGRPNGKTKRRKALAAMTSEERVAHRKKWKAEQRKFQYEQRDTKRLKRLAGAPQKSSKK